jgi:hypothetical protein
MSGLYVIWSRRSYDQLLRRRQGYGHLELDGGTAYFREEHNTDFLGRREGSHIRMMSQWFADIRMVAEDPTSTIFFVDMKGRESVEDAIRRGLALPVVRAAHAQLLVDSERRLASDFMR